MRLWLSLAVLVILACVVIEISEAKSNRDQTKSNEKSGANSKEVRYSKNKSEIKKKGNGKKQEAAKERKPRDNVGGNENVGKNEASKKNKNEKNGKASYDHEQKKQKSASKQDKIGKNNEHYKNNKNVKTDKDNTGKKQKRSVEADLQKDENSAHYNARDSSKQREDPRSKFPSNEISKNEFETEVKTLEVEPEGISDDQQSEETASSLEKDPKSLKEDKIAGKRSGKSKEVKDKKHGRKSAEVLAETSESTEEEFQDSKGPVGLDKGIEKSVDDVPRGKASKKQKPSKTVSKSKSKLEDCKSQESDAKKEVKRKSQKYDKSGSCNSESQHPTAVQNKTGTDEPRNKEDKVEEQETEEVKSDGLNIQATEGEDEVEKDNSDESENPMLGSCSVE